jgi:hypothetical protein
MPRNVLRVLATMLVMLGLLTLGVTPAVAQQEPTVEVTIDQATIDPRTGEVTLTLTVTCSGFEEFRFALISGELRQRPVDHPVSVWAPFRQGREPVQAPCPPEGFTYTVTFSAVQGTFRPGPAHLTVVVAACVPIFPTRACGSPVVERLDTTIILTPAH